MVPTNELLADPGAVGSRPSLLGRCKLQADHGGHLGRGVVGARSGPRVALTGTLGPLTFAPNLAPAPLATVEDFVAVSEAFSGMGGIAAVELNLSCPNVDGGLHFSTRADSAAEVVSACRRVLDKPLWVKLSPNVTDTVPLARACEESGADALTVCNTLLGLLVDWKSREPLLGRGYGGVSGPAVLPVAMRLVHQVSRSVSIPVIASGGASSPEDVLAFLVAGASAVQIGTASFRRPDAISAIADGMRSLLKENGLAASDLVGSLNWDGRGEKPREN